MLQLLLGVLAEDDRSAIPPAIAPATRAPAAPAKGVPVNATPAEIKVLIAVKNSV